MKNLTNYIFEEDTAYLVETVNSTNDNTNKIEQQNIPGGINAGIVAEIRMYSETTPSFAGRKRALANWFKTNVDKTEINSRRISRTPIFRLYTRDLIHFYKKNIDDKLKLNVSTQAELKRQIAIDIVNLAVTGNMAYSDFDVR